MQQTVCMLLITCAFSTSKSQQQADAPDHPTPRDT